MDRPTLDNWMRPPHPFWSFRHVRELIPTSRIRHGWHPRALPFEAVGDLLDLRFDAKAGERVLGEYLATTQTDAFVAIKDGKVVLEWMAPGVRDDEPHLMFSVTKSITALLCGALVGANLIDPDAPVVQYVPAVAGSGFGDATVRPTVEADGRTDEHRVGDREAGVRGADDQAHVGGGAGGVLGDVFSDGAHDLRVRLDEVHPAHAGLAR